MKWEMCVLHSWTCQLLILVLQKNIFEALKQSLESNNLDFNNAVAFMSDTASVMKSARSGVQKRIQTEMLHLHDVGCINHMADLTITAGMETLPILTRYLLIYSIIFTIEVKVVSFL